ncbi:hypothetical protein [Flaviramulus basaltis]|nr:hypothetical protein [Flaviramulus basaltis]
MKSKIIVITIFMSFVVQILQAQSRSLKTTKVVCVVENRTNNIVGLELFDQQESKALIKKYPKSKFYLGILKGTFTVKDNLVKPSKNTSIIIYTNKNELPGDMFIPGDMFLPGDMFIPGDMFSTGHNFFINNSKLQVIESSKSQLVFKAY